MARKLIRETDLSKVVRGLLSHDYDVVRVETKLDDGWSDLLAIQKSTGLPYFIELKQIDNLTKSGYTRIDLEPIQALFLWQRVRSCPHTEAAVMLRVGERDFYTFPARSETEWPKWIRDVIYPDQLIPPLCFRHSASNILQTLEDARGARFTPAHLVGGR